MRKHVCGSPVSPTKPYPVAATKILSDLRDLVGQAAGYKMTYRRLGKVIGKSTSTTHYWFEAYHHPNLIAFFRLLERLAPRDRHAFLEKYCRVFPRFTDPEWIQNQNDARALLQLASAKTGITIIRGMTSSWRNFLVGGICASYAEANGGRRFAVCVDLEQSPDFVPPEWLLPLDRTKRMKEIRDEIFELWPRLVVSESDLIVLNGVCRYTPEILNNLKPIAAAKQIVVVDRCVPILRGPFPIRIVKIVHKSEDPRSVRFFIEHVPVGSCKSAQ